MEKKPKQRLDSLVQAQHPNLTRNQIQSFILQGKVKVEGVVISKPGTSVRPDSLIELAILEPKYVSRAGFKLEAALQKFGIDVTGLVVMDAGISTGGFTDCLLQHGAQRVYGVDVGVGLVHEKVAQDSRVVLLEKTNLRLLNRLPEPIDLATLDLSFISLLKVMPAVKGLLKPEARILSLIKPQFEADRQDIHRGGLVISPEVHQKVIEKIRLGMAECGYQMVDVMESPVKGAASGNTEFLAYFVPVAKE
jgi:23S rRNA (cytidine1920-2'-O)/16S rRNA (cytidine1409-2'-O)-methyltransferase